MDATKTAIKIFDKHAIEYQNKFMDLDLYHDSFNLFCDSIKKENAEILEIACGPGNITKFLLKKRPDLKILGIDLAPKMIELAKSNNPTANFKIMNAKDIEKVNQKFDGVMCGFCLPYLSKEESFKLISDVSNLLNPNGIFYLSTMENDYEKSGFKKPSSGGEEELFIYYHQADYLTKSLKENGFEIINLTRQEYPNSEVETTIDLLILAGKTMAL